MNHPTHSLLPRFPALLLAASCSLLTVAGCLIAAARPLLAVVALVAFVLIYTPVVEREEIVETTKPP